MLLIKEFCEAYSLIQKKILLNHHILLQVVGLDSYQTIGGKCQQNDTQPDEDQS